MIIRRGDIYYADLRPVVGSEQGGIRPVLVVQNDGGSTPLTSTNTNSLLAKVLTIASSFFVPFVAVSQGVTEIFIQTRESLKWT